MVPGRADELIEGNFSLCEGDGTARAVLGAEALVDGLSFSLGKILVDPVEGVKHLSELDEFSFIDALVVVVIDLLEELLTDDHVVEVVRASGLEVNSVKQVDLVSCECGSVDLMVEICSRDIREVLDGEVDQLALVRVSIIVKSDEVLQVCDSLDSWVKICCADESINGVAEEVLIADQGSADLLLVQIAITVEISSLESNINDISDRDRGSILRESEVIDLCLKCLLLRKEGVVVEVREKLEAKSVSHRVLLVEGELLLSKCSTLFGSELSKGNLLITIHVNVVELSLELLLVALSLIKGQMELLVLTHEDCLDISAADRDRSVSITSVF